MLVSVISMEKNHVLVIMRPCHRASRKIDLILITLEITWKHEHTTHFTPSYWVLITKSPFRSNVGFYFTIEFMLKSRTQTACWQVTIRMEENYISDKNKQTCMLLQNWSFDDFKLFRFSFQFFKAVKYTFFCCQAGKFQNMHFAFFVTNVSTFFKQYNLFLTFWILPFELCVSCLFFIIFSCRNVYSFTWMIQYGRPNRESSAQWPG